MLEDGNVFCVCVTVVADGTTAGAPAAGAIAGKAFIGRVNAGFAAGAEAEAGTAGVAGATGVAGAAKTGTAGVCPFDFFA